MYVTITLLFLQPFYLESVSKDNDTLLRFFETECPLYDKQITNNKVHLRIVRMFSGASE